jgi:hypothetical protein
MKLPRLPLLAVAAIGAIAQLNAQSTVATDPVGFVTISNRAGSGAAKTTSFVSIPLLDVASITGQSAGSITGVASNALTNSNAGWSAGELSSAVAPYLIQMTSGNASGRMFLISTTVPSTTTSLTINQNDLTAQGPLNATAVNILPGDTYVIRPCDTLGSFFSGDVLNQVQKGTSATNSDTVVLTVNGSPTAYFYRSSAPAGWVTTSRGTASGNVPISPNAGMQYQRIAATPLVFTVTGSVPTGLRKVAVLNSGTTVLSQFWPVNSTVAGLGLQTIPGWLSGGTAKVADIVQVQSTNGSQTAYYFDGTNWKDSSRGRVSDTAPVALGSSLVIVKKGSATTYSTLSQAVPYNLQ